MLLLVAVSVAVACSINVIMTLAPTVANRLFGLNLSGDVLALNYYVAAKIRQLSVHIYTHNTSTVSAV
jgi:hypothetical protein